MRMKRTQRGFGLGKFKDQYGYDCSIQKSSLATADCIWLGIDEPHPMIFPGNNTGWHPFPLPKNVSCSTRMHLTRAMVKKLLPALQYFVKTGDLPRR